MDLFDDTQSSEEAKFWSEQGSITEDEIGSTEAEERRKVAEWQNRIDGKHLEFQDDRPENEVRDAFEEFEEATESYSREDWDQGMAPQERQFAQNISQYADQISLHKQQLVERIEKNKGLLFDQDGQFKTVNRENDPLGYLMQKEELQEINQLAAQVQAAEQHAMNAAVQMCQQQEADYRKSHPDYDDAFEYLERSVLNQFVAAGLSPQEAQAQWQQECQEMLAKCVDNGRSIPKSLMTLAKARGYSAKRVAGRKLQRMANKPETIESMLNTFNSGAEDKYASEFDRMFRGS